jgi:hypothetical protein
MSDTNWNWLHWSPRRLMWLWKCPYCNSKQFKPAELRALDHLLCLFALHPVRCKFCWRRTYKLALSGVDAR